jgi:hypothetical protein
MTEVIMALAFVQQCAEHIASRSEDRGLFTVRLALSLLLVIGFATLPALLALCVISLLMLARFGGPYNGGSDKMSLLILWCVSATHLMPTRLLQETMYAYLAVQLTLSYFISGQIKIVNPEWRRGQALVDVFAFSAYPVSEGLRRLANYPRLMWVMSWGVMLFEVVFPLALFHQTALLVALFIGAAFHFANACLFGLNRFFWIWLAAYPALIWFQERFLEFLWVSGV